MVTRFSIRCGTCHIGPTQARTSMVSICVQPTKSGRRDVESVVAILIAKLLSPIAAVLGVASGVLLRQRWHLVVAALTIATVEEWLLSSAQITRQFSPSIFLIGAVAASFWVWVGGRIRALSARKAGRVVVEDPPGQTRVAAAPTTKSEQVDQLLSDVGDPNSQLYDQLEDFRVPDADGKRAVLEQAIATGKLLGAATPRRAFEIMLGRPSTDEEWNNHREPWELLWPYVRSADKH
jgi:hypothetical protein